MTASYLSDALGDLAAAVIGILRGQPATQASFTEEPGEYRWIFTAVSADRLGVRIREFADWNQQDGRLIFRAECRTESFASALLSALRDIHSTLGPEGYRQKWVEYGFPTGQMTELAELLGRA